MFEIVVEDIFSAAHKLRNYKGKCENVHGHNWKVQVAVYGRDLDNRGLLLDFTVLKAELKKVLQSLDHKDINNLPFFRKINPTSENIAFYVHEKIKNSPAIKPARVKSVTVWESDRQYAIYTEEGS